MGIVPHYLHLQALPIISLVKKAWLGFKVVRCSTKPSSVGCHIARCEHILSFFLHGLIVAHSLGIPVLAFEINTPPLRGGRYKHKDKYFAFDEKPGSHSPHGNESLARQNAEASSFCSSFMIRNVLLTE